MIEVDETTVAALELEDAVSTFEMAPLGEAYRAAAEMETRGGVRDIWFLREERAIIRKAAHARLRSGVMVD